jgi:hypothetical protein
MPLQSEAQFLVVDPSSGGSPMSLVPMEVSEHDHGHGHEAPPQQHHFNPEDFSQMEVDEPGEVSIVVEELPGAPQGTKDPEPEIEVADAAGPAVVEEDANDAKKSKKDPKWDWEAHGPTGFITWVKSRCDDVPKHSGYDSAGLERAVAYLERLDGEISRAMRMDLDGELDANQIEKTRAMIDEGISRLHDRLDKVKKVKKSKRTKKKTASEETNDLLIKEAQKITGVSGVMIVADLLTSRIARVCINGMVSAGHDIEDLYARQVKEYGLNKREQACVMQLLTDMGYPLRQDRGFMPDEEIDLASSDNMDWAANYKG